MSDSSDSESSGGETPVRTRASKRSAAVLDEELEKNEENVEVEKNEELEEPRKSPPKSQNNAGPPKKKPKYTRNHDVTCEGEITLPDGRLAIQYSVVMHDTKDLKRSDTTYLGHVTVREWQESRNALLALGNSLKPFAKVLKAGEWEDYADYLKSKHEEWEHEQISESNKRCIYLSKPSFEFVEEKLYFISGSVHVWNLEVAPFGEKLSGDQIKALPFVIIYTGTEEEFLYDPQKCLEEISLFLKNINEAQMYRGKGEAPSSKFLSACPAVLDSMLKGYLYEPATHKGLMATLTWALSGKEFSCGKSWCMLCSAHLILGPTEDDIKKIKVDAGSSPSGIWEHIDEHSLLVIDELQLDPVFIGCMGIIVDNKFNNCSKKLNGKTYNPRAGILVMGNYLQEDILNLTKGRGKPKVLEPKTVSKMTFLMIGNKRITHPDTGSLREESLKAAGRAHNFLPMVLAVKWQSMFQEKNKEEWNKIHEFTSNDRATTQIIEFQDFTQKLKDLMIEFEVDLPPCLDQPEVNLNIHSYFFLNKGRDPEDFIEYIMESNSCGIIEMGTHKSINGIKLRLKDFSQNGDWYPFLSDAEQCVSSFKGHRSKQLRFIPCNTVSDRVMNRLKRLCFSVKNAIEDDMMAAENDIKLCLNKIVAAIKKNAMTSEVLTEAQDAAATNAQNAANPEVEDILMNIPPGPSKKEYKCDVYGCKKNGHNFSSKTGLSLHEKSRSHCDAVAKNGDT